VRQIKAFVFVLQHCSYFA